MLYCIHINMPPILFLSHNHFSMKIHYPKNFSKSRNRIILDYCKDKKVLHIWACDAPYTQGKLDWHYGPLLYAEIDKVCSQQLWIDLDKESINLLTEKKYLFPKSEVRYFDMNEISTLDFHPDIIIFWETIEHLMNLETALTNLKWAMTDDTILVISTPNAYYLSNFIASMFGVEDFHDDHKVLFSYGYLLNLLRYNNLKIIKGYFTTLDSFLWSSLNIFWKIRYILEMPFQFLLKFNSSTLLLFCKKIKK